MWFLLLLWLGGSVASASAFVSATTGLAALFAAATAISVASGSGRCGSVGGDSGSGGAPPHHPCRPRRPRRPPVGPPRRRRGHLIFQSTYVYFAVGSSCRCDVRLLPDADVISMRCDAVCLQIAAACYYCISTAVVYLFGSDLSVQ